MMWRWHFTTKHLFLLLALAASCAVIARTIHQRASKARRDAVAARFSQITAMIMTADMCEHGRLQAVCRDERGTAQSSWRFQILSHISMDYGTTPDWNGPWNTTRNLQFAEQGRGLYCFAQEKGPAARRYDTNVMAIVGPDTAFDTARRLDFQDLPEDVVVLCEVFDSRIHWMQPGDLSLERLRNVGSSPGIRLGGFTTGGFHVAFADGQVWLLSAQTPRETLMKMVTISGAAEADRAEVLGPYCLERYDYD